MARSPALVWPQERELNLMDPSSTGARPSFPATQTCVDPLDHCARGLHCHANGVRRLGPRPPNSSDLRGKKPNLHGVDALARSVARVDTHEAGVNRHLVLDVARSLQNLHHLVRCGANAQSPRFMAREDLENGIVLVRNRLQLNLRGRQLRGRHGAETRHGSSRRGCRHEAWEGTLQEDKVLNTFETKATDVSLRKQTRLLTRRGPRHYVRTSQPEIQDMHRASRRDMSMKVPIFNLLHVVHATAQAWGNQHVQVYWHISTTY